MLFLCLKVSLALSPAEQVSDIAQVQELIRYHPDYEDPVVAAKIDIALTDVPIDDDIDVPLFYARLMKALVVFQDGHTDAIIDGIHLSKFLSDSRFLPFDAMVFEDSLYLDPRFHEPARVVSIDGRSGEEIVAELRTSVVSDSAKPSTRDYDIDRFFSNRYAQHWGFEVSYEVVLDPPVMGGERIQGVTHEKVPYIGDAVPNDVTLDEQGLLWVTLSEIDGPEWVSFWRALRRGIRKADSVVLDLRGCGGGFEPTEKELLSLFLTEPASLQTSRRISSFYGQSQPDESPYRIVYAPDDTGAWVPRPHLRASTQQNIVKPWRHAWQGALVVIIGSGTFSSCSNFASELSTLRDDVLLIGSETSGGSRRINAGQFEGKLLSASGIYVQVPLVQLTKPEHFGLLGQGVQPDISVVDRPDTRENEVEVCTRSIATTKNPTCPQQPSRPTWLHRETIGPTLP